MNHQRDLVPRDGKISVNAEIQKRSSACATRSSVERVMRFLYHGNMRDGDVARVIAIRVAGRFDDE